MERPALFRIEQASNPAELEKACEHALTAGFDGVEIVGYPGVPGVPTLPVGAVGGMVKRSEERAKPAKPTWHRHLAGESIPARREKPVPQAAPDRTTPAVAVAACCVATDIETGLAEVTALLHQAASFRAQCLNLTIPPVGGNAGQERFSRYQDALNFAYQLLRQVRHEAESTGVAIALEAACVPLLQAVPQAGCLLSPVELREIIDAANSWAVGACIDVTRIARIGLPEDWIKTLRGRVHAVRVRIIASPGQPASSPDEETVNVDAIAEALDEIRYDRPVIATGPGELKEIRLQLVKLGCPTAHA